MQTDKAFSEIKDVDKQILQNLDDRDLFQLLLTKNKYIYYLTDDMFWKNRLQVRYPATVEYKPDQQKWKQYYLNVVYYIDKLEREKGFIYTKGDPKFIYESIFLHKHIVPGNMSVNASNLVKKGYEDLALYHVNKIRKEFGTPLFNLGTPE